MRLPADELAAARRSASSAPTVCGCPTSSRDDRPTARRRALVDCELLQLAAHVTLSSARPRASRFDGAALGIEVEQRIYARHGRSIVRRGPRPIAQAPIDAKACRSE